MNALLILLVSAATQICWSQEKAKLPSRPQTKQKIGPEHPAASKVSSQGLPVSLSAKFSQTSVTLSDLTLRQGDTCYAFGTLKNGGDRLIRKLDFWIVFLLNDGKTGGYLVEREQLGPKEEINLYLECHPKPNNWMRDNATFKGAYLSGLRLELEPTEDEIEQEEKASALEEEKTRRELARVKARIAAMCSKFRSAMGNKPVAPITVNEADIRESCKKQGLW